MFSFLTLEVNCSIKKLLCETRLLRFQNYITNNIYMLGWHIVINKVFSLGQDKIKSYWNLSLYKHEKLCNRVMYVGVTVYVVSGLLQMYRWLTSNHSNYFLKSLIRKLHLTINVYIWNIPWCVHTEMCEIWA